MKPEHLLTGAGILLAVVGLWFGHAAWRAHRQLVTLDVPNAALDPVLCKNEWQVCLMFNNSGAAAACEADSAGKKGVPTVPKVKAWDGKVHKAAIAETVRLAREALLDDDGRLCHG